MDISNSTKKEQSTFGIILWIVLISYFLILLNNSLVFASTVQIRRELGMNGVMLSWVSNAYALTFGGFLSLGARLGDIFGRRLALLSGLAIFGLASLLVALSPSAGILIAMRALQGIGGALLAPSTLALLMDTYEGQQRTRAITYYGATAGIGSSLGLIIGGIISSYSSWRLGFLLDADVALVLYAMSVKNVAAGKGQKDQAIDWWGTVTSVIGFSGLVYSINATAYRAGAIIVTIVSLAAFIMIESKTANPLMPLEIFKDNQRSSALVARFFMLGASMAYFFMMPQALQNVFGMSALQAAIAFLPLTVVQFIISLFVARLTFRFSNTAVLIAGAVIDAAGLAMGAVIGIEEGYLLGVALPMVFIGLGQGLIMSPLTVAGVAGTRGDIAGAASGAVNTFHQIGGAVGL
ncbi:MFS transporter, partial [Lactobacillus nasalidis]|uniref:MFS transporter n=3 Tax=Lactobacillus nasalidis TaxID=2797258 RepID=UPI0019169326